MKAQVLELLSFYETNTSSLRAGLFNLGMSHADSKGWKGGLSVAASCLHAPFTP